MDSAPDLRRVCCRELPPRTDCRSLDCFHVRIMNVFATTKQNNDSNFLSYSLTSLLKPAVAESLLLQSLVFLKTLNPKAPCLHCSHRPLSLSFLSLPLSLLNSCGAHLLQVVYFFFHSVWILYVVCARIWTILWVVGFESLYDRACTHAQRRRWIER